MLGRGHQFSIARHGGRAAVDELSGPRLRTWQDRIERGGFLAVLYARIAPLSPFVVINYVSGLTRLRLGTFALATLIPSSRVDSPTRRSAATSTTSTRPRRSPRSPCSSRWGWRALPRLERRRPAAAAGDLARAAAWRSRAGQGER